MLSYRVLSTMLCYPGADFRQALPQMIDALRDEGALSGSRIARLRALATEIAGGDPYEIEARYVQLFDRGRATSLHLFEHVHGDSRDRGQAMVDLLETYATAGLDLGARELPDFLPVALEFASTQPPQVAKAFVGEFAHILNKVHAALLERRSAYANVIAAVLELSGERVDASAVADEDEPLDQAWEEPAAFDGCSSRGQAAQSGEAQPVHFFPNNSTPSNRRAQR